MGLTVAKGRNDPVLVMLLKEKKKCPSIHDVTGRKNFPVTVVSLERNKCPYVFGVTGKKKCLGFVDVTGNKMYQHQWCH